MIAKAKQQAIATALEKKYSQMTTEQLLNMDAPQGEDVNLDFDTPTPTPTPEPEPKPEKKVKEDKK